MKHGLDVNSTAGSRRPSRLGGRRLGGRGPARGRLPCAPVRKKTAQLDITRCDLPGRIDIDLLEELRRANGPKLPNLKLDTVARKYLGRTKIDLPAKEIFAKFRSGQPDDIAAIAEYCARLRPRLRADGASQDDRERDADGLHLRRRPEQDPMGRADCQGQAAAVPKAFVAKAALRVAVK